MSDSNETSNERTDFSLRVHDYLRDLDALSNNYDKIKTVPLVKDPIDKIKNTLDANNELLKKDFGQFVELNAINSAVNRSASLKRPLYNIDMAFERIIQDTNYKTVDAMKNVANEIRDIDLGHKATTSTYTPTHTEPAQSEPILQTGKTVDSWDLPDDFAKNIVPDQKSTQSSELDKPIDELDISKIADSVPTEPTFDAAEADVQPESHAQNEETVAIPNFRRIVMGNVQPTSGESDWSDDTVRLPNLRRLVKRKTPTDQPLAEPAPAQPAPIELPPLEQLPAEQPPVEPIETLVGALIDEIPSEKTADITPEISSEPVLEPALELTLPPEPALEITSDTDPMQESESEPIALTIPVIVSEPEQIIEQESLSPSQSTSNIKVPQPHDTQLIPTTMLDIPVVPPLSEPPTEVMYLDETINSESEDIKHDQQLPEPEPEVVAESETHPVPQTEPSEPEPQPAPEPQPEPQPEPEPELQILPQVSPVDLDDTLDSMTPISAPIIAPQLPPKDEPVSKLQYAISLAKQGGK